MEQAERKCLISSYLQLGHHSANLLKEPGLSGFDGAILSPVNYGVAETNRSITPKIEELGMRLVIDPQLYNPRNERGKLSEWNYFPSDFDSADMSSEVWWDGIAAGLAADANEISAQIVCSPATIPKTYSDDYYDLCVSAKQKLSSHLHGANISTFQTVIVDFDDISASGKAARVASIVSRDAPNGVYLVVVTSVKPRLELSDAESLTAVMLLIHYLETAGIPVLVSHSSSDVVLWKAAGATLCSTGKFFNLRRFTSSRFDEPTDERRGGALPYWFEESLLAFLREGDLIRLKRDHPELIGIGSSTNSYSDKVFDDIEGSQAWLGCSWRHYLAWFMNIENRLQSGGVSFTERLLLEAEANWQTLAQSNFLTEEVTNNGSWIRLWRIAVAQFLSRTS